MGQGQRVVHHGRDDPILTNDPTDEQQIALVKQQDFPKPSSDTPLPGNVKPSDRFQRAAYFAALLPEPKSEREAVAGLLAIIRHVSVPFGAPCKGFGRDKTEYRTVMNLVDKCYFFELTTSPNVLWVSLEWFDLTPCAPVLILDPDAKALSGDGTGTFKKALTAPF
ncbi:linear amide C-N hydrolase [Synechococcus sp. CCY 0621]|uniref:linear amide C-N hydrolase n=1 Tax=Synechococcus sp. CCY 0621 TaxID=2815603 RepID=UPI001C24AEB3|nr:linear amide C-N hydrolase [Synechococcus sp. CCY 0621]